MVITRSRFLESKMLQSLFPHKMLLEMTAVKPMSEGLSFNILEYIPNASFTRPKTCMQ